MPLPPVLLLELLVLPSLPAEAPDEHSMRSAARRQYEKLKEKSRGTPKERDGKGEKKRKDDILHSLVLLLLLSPALLLAALPLKSRPERGPLLVLALLLVVLLLDEVESRAERERVRGFAGKARGAAPARAATRRVRRVGACIFFSFVFVSEGSVCGVWRVVLGGDGGGGEGARGRGCDCQTEMRMARTLSGCTGRARRIYTST